MNSSNLRVQKVDFTASWLLSAWIVASLLVIALLFVWWNGSSKTAVESIVLEDSLGLVADARLVAGDVEPPRHEEAEALTTPSLGDSLAAITDAASCVSANLDSDSLDPAVSGFGYSQLHQAGPTLNSRLGEDDDIVARFERWELQFSAKDASDYAAQLDFYKIELGCVGKAKLVDYADGFSGEIQKRSGKGSDEKRLYFMWRQEGSLSAFDRQLLGQAGIETEGRQLLKFIPPKLEDRLSLAEMKYAVGQGHNKVREIAKTVFKSQPSSSGYDFVVIEQRYRTIR
jgi:hypothetical protein